MMRRIGIDSLRSAGRSKSRIAETPYFLSRSIGSGSVSGDAHVITFESTIAWRHGRFLSDGRNADQSAESDDKPSDPHPDHERANQYFQRGLIAVHLAEARENQVNIFGQAALVNCAADGRLLGGKEFKRGRR